VADARVAEVKRLIDGLRRDRRQHPYRGRGEYSGRAREVAGAIADMIESGGAADAVPLARRAVERVTAAMLHMDDSSGIIGGDLRMLTALYARACRAAPPDPRNSRPGW
jgi:phytoene/squalene synthetase